MSKIQQDTYEIARRAVLGCGGRIVKELTLENGTKRIIYDGCDVEKLRVTLLVMVPDSTFTKISLTDSERG